MDQQTAPIRMRQKQKAETRDRVLASARKLFEAQGYSAVTVRMIADDAGVAVGSVFTAFESKDDLLIEIICEDFSALRVKFAARFAAEANQPLPERIVAALEPALAYDLAHLNKLREVMANSWTRTREQELRTRAAIQPLILTVRDAIVAAKEAGEIQAATDPRLLADMAIQMYLTNIRNAAFDGWDAPKVAATHLAQLRHILR
jgi:TetR/AcrR family transcriptional regulator, cholesterol catabolism regulator